MFFDDRFDMYPPAVGEASFDLLAGRPDYQAILDRYRVDTVLWEKKLPLAVVLRADRRWRVVHTTKPWVVVTEPATDSPGSAGFAPRSAGVDDAVGVAAVPSAGLLTEQRHRRQAHHCDECGEEDVFDQGIPRLVSIDAPHDHPLFAPHRPRVWTAMK